MRMVSLRVIVGSLVPGLLHAPSFSPKDASRDALIMQVPRRNQMPRRQLKIQALLPLGLLSAGLLLGPLSVMAAEPCRLIATDASIGLANNHVEIAFDKKTGALTRLKNLATADEYLKDAHGSGNPFRIYLNPAKLPPAVERTFPWRGPMMDDGDTLGATVIDARDCQLVDFTHEHSAGHGQLGLQIRHPSTGLLFHLEVRLPDDRDHVDCTLTVQNGGQQNAQLLTAFPYLTGVGLGPHRTTNLGVKMKKHGIPGEPAWVDSGGIYGRSVIGQWQSVYEPSLDEGLGMIVMDAALRNKILHRFAPSGMSVLYYPADKIAPGSEVAYPTTRLLIHRGNWRRVARDYYAWFRSAFQLRLPPRWYDEMDLFGSSWISDPKEVAKAKLAVAELGEGDPGREQYFTSFRDLPYSYVNHPTDLWELAMYHEGLVRTGSHGQDGTYHFRSDLGGPEAIRKGVDRMHRIGRRVTFYIAAISTRKDSDLFNGENIDDWLLMEEPGKMLDIGYPFGVSMCHGYAPWQDHIAAVSKRLLEESGADGVRLDEFGTPSIACYNPAHHHASPFDGNKWALELLRKVRAAMDEVNPDAILMTEAACDFMHLYSDGGGLQMFYPGREIDALRVAVPTYRGPGHSPGAVECALNGIFANRTSATRQDYPGYGQWFPPKPAHLTPGAGPQLRWHELRATFRAAQNEGTVTDVDPHAIDDPHWVGRLWRAETYCVLIGGHEDASALPGPVRVRLPELPSTIVGAYEIDAQKLILRNAELTGSDGERVVTVESGFGAVLLPTADCPAMVTVDGALPTLRAGSENEITLQSFAPWSKDRAAVVNVMVDGVGFEETNLELPAVVKIKPPGDTLPGIYPLKVTGDCLPMKRWLRVER